MVILWPFTLCISSLLSSAAITHANKAKLCGKRVATSQETMEAISFSARSSGKGWGRASHLLISSIRSNSQQKLFKDSKYSTMPVPRLRNPLLDSRRSEGRLESP